MKPSRDDLLIDRYLDRRMGVQEEQAFVARLDSDPRLYAMVETERAIRASMQAEGASFAASHAAQRAALLETLAATAPAQQTGTSLMAGLLGSTFLRSVIGLVIVGAILIVLWPSLTSPGTDESGTGIPNASSTEHPSTGSEPGAASAPARSEGTPRTPDHAADAAVQAPGTLGSTSTAIHERSASHNSVHGITATSAASPIPESHTPAGAIRNTVAAPAHTDAEEHAGEVTRTQTSQPALKPMVFPAESVRTSVKVETSKP